MKYKEHDIEYESIPGWASWMIQCGRYYYRKSYINSGVRLLTVITMPCSSHASGLVALGALLESMEIQDPPTQSSYMDELLQRAEKCLLNNQSSLLLDSEGKKWRLVEVNKDERSLKVVSEKVQRQIRRAKKKSMGTGEIHGDVISPILEFNCLNWRFENDSLPYSKAYEPAAYQELSKSDSFNQEALEHSSRDISLVARALGDETKYRTILRSTELYLSGKWLNLEDLLQLSGDINSISKVSLTSPRVDETEIDEPVLTVVEGANNSSSVLSTVKKGSVIILVSRDESNDSIEALDSALESKSRYFDDLVVTELHSPNPLIAIKSMIQGGV